MSKRQDRRRARLTAKLHKQYGGPKGVNAALAQAQADMERERAKRPHVKPLTPKS